ncbi:MAG TPA: DUF4974 domain-containing protein [Candidatus Butyricimonas faecavium]|nr:DUF4974 domain-containing protein [Candidatus Butyricimonas faecavium]
MDQYDENITRLIRHSLIGEFSEQERGELEAWLHDSKEHQLLFEKIKKEIRISSESSLFRSLNEEVAWLKFKSITRERKRRAYVRQILTYAAIIVLPLAVVAGFWFLNQEKNTYPMASERIVRITPGSPRAVLITADQTVHELNGVQELREIEVEKGVVVKQGGGNLEYDSLVTLGQEVTLAMNTLKIPRGGEFRLKLSDGTNVYLNSASELKYPVCFNEKERTVYLSGEAYFEVTEDLNRPFYVVTEEVQIRVYGTEFNVNTHQPGKVYTVLVDGKVGIKKRGVVEEVTMKPGQLASFDRKEGTIEVRDVDVRQYVVWKDGYFTFENESLEQILNTLSLWYDVDVFFQTESTKHLVFTGYMKRYNDISEILDAITDVVGVNFTINGKTIIVSK